MNERGKLEVEVELVDFSKQGEAGLLGAGNLEGGFRGNEGETRGGERDDLISEVNFAGAELDIDDVFVVIRREMGAAADGVEGDEDLREIGTHGRRNHHVGGGVFPAGEGGGDMTVRGDQGVALGERGASLAEDGHRLW